MIDDINLSEEPEHEEEGSTESQESTEEPKVSAAFLGLELQKPSYENDETSEEKKEDDMGKGDDKDEKEKEEEEEETSQSILRTSNMTSTPPTSLPTVHRSASEMFKDTGLRAKSTLANGTCPNPRSKRGATEKDIARTKERAVQPINSLFESPYYYVSGKYDVDDDKQELNKSACDAIISCTFSCKEMNFQVKDFDMMNSILIPALVNPAGDTPAARWDFTKNCQNLLEEFGSITFEEVKQWILDSLLWSVSTYEAQDQEWLLL